LGWGRQREVVHQYAQNDSRVLPPSGLPIGNIQGGFAYLDNYKKDLGALCFPADGAGSAPYPFYDRWGDSFNTTTEFVITDQGRSLGTAAFLMAQGELKKQSWRTAAASITKTGAASITRLPPFAPVGEDVSVTLKSRELDLRQARIVWEARDQEPAIAPSFVFSPRNVGDQWVEAEAILPDGRRVFAKAGFRAVASTNTPPNPFFSSELAVTPEVVALFHVNDSLEDATGRASRLQLAGSVESDSSNLSWMKRREGAALWFKDLQDKATTEIDLRNVSGGISELTLQAMIYIDGFKAYNKGNAKILSLSEDWNSTIELIENQYEGPMVKGGSQFSIDKKILADALSLTNWNHVAISLDRQGYTFRVNGKVVKTIESSELQNWGRKPAALEIGNFDGYIDEIAVLRKGSGEKAKN